MSPEQMPRPPFHEDEPLSQDALRERYAKIFEGLKTSADELRSVYDKEGMSPRFNDLLDDIAYVALQQCDEFRTNVESLRSGRLSANQDRTVRERQQVIFSDYKKMIIEEAGLPTEASLSELERAKEHVVEIVNEFAHRPGKKTPNDILHHLGILVNDENKREIFVYPEDLFPESVNHKWDVYIESVLSHLRAQRDLSHGTGSQQELASADRTRRYAHNAISKDVDEILGFNELPDSQWNIEKTRDLLAKMRDSRFPTVETAEAAMTAAAIAGGLGLHVASVLGTRLSDLHRKQ